MAAPAIEIARLWHRLFAGFEVTQKLIDDETIEPYEVEQIPSLTYGVLGYTTSVGL